MINIKTNHGDITVEIFENEAPITSENFLQYIKDQSYDGTIFHRVIPNFMIQGGGMDENMMSISTKNPIKNEANNGLKNKRGTLAMARTNVVDSATSQFFINLNDNDFLNHGDRDFGYAVFGKVVNGMEVVDLIAKVATGNKNGHQDVPLETVEIIEVKIND
ncbi:MAG: peptidyl-prolyl cis-trans isomerase A [Woeseia sp.]|mgnify:FL=1|nr:peptidyl-prolyl cis-trans isomerase A [Woeseia sp.]|tara:strand:+ start:5870 stop:6355 length:486 start_codon:yes stop_codon:yes gene_type:complete